jgi:putative lysine transport system permease protein
MLLMETRGFGEQMLYTFSNWGSELLEGAGVTMLIAITGTVVGLIIGLAIGVVRTIPTGPHDGTAFKRVCLRVASVVLSIYIEVFRGTPMMVQAMIIYFGGGQAFGWNLNPLESGLIIVSINTGAYMAEIVRGGIESVDPGQTEAGKALGLTHWQIMRGTVLPQAIRHIMPATGNEFVINIKDTSVLIVISVTELMFTGQTIAGQTYRPLETYLSIAAIYLVLTFVTTRLLRLIERRLSGPDTFTLATSETMPDSIIGKDGLTMSQTLRLRESRERAENADAGGKRR